MYYFIVSNSFSLVTTDSSNLISKAVVVWSLIENALTLHGWNAKQFIVQHHYLITSLRINFYYFPMTLNHVGL